MKVKFIGADGSLGFVHGGIYEVEVYIKSQLLRTDGRVWVKVKGSRLHCPYNSVEVFLKNWEVVE